MTWLHLATAFGLGAFVSFAVLRVKLEDLQAAHRAELEALRRAPAPPDHHHV